MKLIRFIKESILKIFRGKYQKKEKTDNILLSNFDKEEVINKTDSIVLSSLDMQMIVNEILRRYRKKHPLEKESEETEQDVKDTYTIIKKGVMTVDIKERQELLKQKETIINRLKKLEENKKGVEEKIYDKIREYYQIQLESLQENVFKKSVSLKNELSQLRLQQQEIKDKYTIVKDEIDEINAKHETGEYNNEEEYRRIVSIEDEKLKNFYHKLQMINERINLYSSMIEKSEDSSGFIQKEEVLEEQVVPIESELDELPSDFSGFEAATSLEETTEAIIKEVVYCSRCGAENPIDAKNCKECGSDLTDDVFETINCPECGAKNSFDQTNCTECGAELIPIDDLIPIEFESKKNLKSIDLQSLFKSIDNIQIVEGIFIFENRKEIYNFLTNNTNFIYPLVQLYAFIEEIFSLNRKNLILELIEDIEENNQELSLTIIFTELSSEEATKKLFQLDEILFEETERDILTKITIMKKKLELEYDI